jgi:hypothetical protein
MLDCHGAISIWNDDNGKYDVAYNPQASLTIAEIKEVDDFQLVRGDMYLIDVRPVGACAIPTRGKYCRSFRVSGESKEFGYSGPDQIQTYLIINTKTGDERFYAGLKDAPETDRAIFQSLVAR